MAWSPYTALLLTTFLQFFIGACKTFVPDVTPTDRMNIHAAAISDDEKKGESSYHNSDVIFELPDASNEISLTFNPVELRRKGKELRKLTPPSEVTECTTTHNSVDVLVDCSFRGIRSVNASRFQYNVTNLQLGYNLISVLTNGTFSALKHLRTLNLSFNEINEVSAQAFQGLESLEVLNIEYNQLVPEKLFKHDIFSCLPNLKALWLRQGKTFPSAAFPKIGHLTNLTTLSLDTVGDVVAFGEEFKDLKELTSLTLSGNAKAIDNNSFINVPLLKELRLIDLEVLSEISPNSLAQLKHLNRLEVSCPLGVKKTMRALEPLQKTNMTDIYLKRIMFDVVSGPTLLNQDGILNRSKTKYLLEICLSRFSLLHSDIYIITHDALVSETWKTCLKFIDLSDNPLRGSLVALWRILTIRNLELAIIQDTLYDQEKKTFFPYIPHEMISTSTDNDNESLTTDHVSKSSVKSRLSPEQSGVLMVYASGSLKYLNLHSLFSVLRMNVNIKLIKAEKLEYLDFSNSGLGLFTGEINGFTGLKTFNLSGNDFGILSERFFDSFKSLEELNLAESNLNPDFLCIKSERLFQKLSNLKKLGLERNSLSLLSPNTFSNNRDMTHLILSGNRFNRVPFDLKNNPKLQVLDLQNNAIVSLDEETTDNLDMLAKDLGGFQLMLGGNVMLCVCENFRFLYWLVHTSVTLDRDRNFSCINNDGVLTYTSAFADPVAMWRQCSGQFYFNVSIFLTCAMIIGFLSIFVITRNKTLILSTLLQIFTKFKVLKSEDYKTGVFIGYADDDYVFACTDLRRYIEDTLGLTTYLKDRDLLPTFDMSQGIMEAINSSWRVLLVVNATFLNDDHWSLFTIKSAIYSLTPANPDRVVVLVDELLLTKLPSELLSSVPEDNVITVSRWEMTYRLEEMLRTRLL